MFQRLQRGGWPYPQPPNVPFEVNEDSEQAEGLVVWMPWGGGTPGSHHHVDRIRGLEFTEGGTPVWVSDGQHGWSMLFDVAGSEYLTAAAAVIDDEPLTISAWYNPVGATTWDIYCLACICEAGAQNGWALYYVTRGAVTTIWSQATTVDQWGSNTATTGDLTWPGGWIHLAAVFHSATDRRIYINGVEMATDANNRSPTVVDTTQIGAWTQAGVPASYTQGLVSDVRFNKRGLSPAGIYQMYANPRELYRPRLRRVWVLAPAVGNIKQIATIDWANVKAIGTIAEANIKAVATITAN